jgi:hypothetical protein
MKKYTYKLRLKGLSTPQGTIPLKALKDLCDILLDASERGLRLAVDADSAKGGRLPAWLTSSLDITVTGLEKGSTCLKMDAPALGATAGDKISQQKLWNTAPKPDDTVFSLVSMAIHDTSAGKEDSNYYDTGVLDGLLKMKPFLKNYATGIELSCAERKGDKFTLVNANMEKIQKLKAKTPETQAMVISGKFDAIEHAKKRFHLQLSNGETMLGVIDTEHLGVEQMRQHWGGKVTVKGMVHFHASGKPRLIVADVIKEMADGEEILSHVSHVQTEVEFIGQARNEAGQKKGWLKDVWGQWPGDESTEELIAALKQT